MGGGRKAIVAMVDIDGSDGCGFLLLLMASSRAGSLPQGIAFQMWEILWLRTTFFRQFC
jgi:hypothetical protein